MANLNKKNRAERQHTSKLFYELLSATVEYQENDKRYRDYKNYESQLIDKARRLDKGESNYDERVEVAYKIRELESSLDFVYDRFMMASVKLSRWLDKVHPNEQHFNFLDMGWEKGLTNLEPSAIFFLQSNRMMKRNQSSITLVKPSRNIEKNSITIEDLRD